MGTAGRVIDLHAHVVLEAAFGPTGTDGPEFGAGEAPVLRVGTHERKNMPIGGVRSSTSADTSGG